MLGKTPSITLHITIPANQPLAVVIGSTQRLLEALRPSGLNYQVSAEGSGVSPLTVEQIQQTLNQSTPSTKPPVIAPLDQAVEHLQNLLDRELIQSISENRPTDYRAIFLEQLNQHRATSDWLALSLSAFLSEHRPSKGVLGSAKRDAEGFTPNQLKPSIN